MSVPNCVVHQASISFFPPLFCSLTFFDLLVNKTPPPIIGPEPGAEHGFLFPHPEPELFSLSSPLQKLCTLFGVLFETQALAMGRSFQPRSNAWNSDRPFLWVRPGFFSPLLTWCVDVWPRGSTVPDNFPRPLFALPLFFFLRDWLRSRFRRGAWI